VTSRRPKAIRILQAMVGLLRHGMGSSIGRCSVCGGRTVFVCYKDNKKENCRCLRCGSNSRTRLLAAEVVRTCTHHGASSLRELVKEDHVKEMTWYNTQSYGPIHRFLSKLPRYVCSEYLEDAPPASTENGVRCEDLQTLTFAAETFDVVIHTSLLEHVRQPEEALKECYRVLRPGGYLLFEVPLCDPWVPGLRRTTVPRIEASGDRDRYILPPIYHEDALRRAGSLVYTDFGLDLVETLCKFGYIVEYVCEEYRRSRMSHAVVFRCCVPAPSENSVQATFDDTPPNALK